MFQGLAKSVGGKLLTAVLAVASILVLVWYWRLAPEARAEIWSMARGALIWLGFVVVLPWALFFLPARVVRAENNWISALTLFAYLALDIGFALYLTGGRMGEAWQKGAMILGFLIAAVYNFAVCEFLAQRADDSL
jgi:hypothetical protein